MADLGKTQAQWDAIFEEFFMYLRVLSQLRELQQRYGLTRTKVLELFEQSAVVSKWTFAGVKRGVNTDEGGKLFVNLNDETPGAAQAQIQVYSDSAKTALIAQGDAADGATVTLAQQNNSGLTGTALLGTVAASDVDIVLSLDLDEESKALTLFGTSDASREAFRAFMTRIESLTTTFLNQTSSQKTNMETNFIRTRLAEFLGSGTTLIISADESLDSNGEVVVKFTGLLAELTDAMNDETTAGVQSVRENIVTVAAPAFDPDNIGKGTVTNISDRDYAPNGTVTFKCTAGKATTLQELFEATLIDEDGRTLRARTSLQILKEWESSSFGFRIKLNRTIIDTLDGSNQVSGYVVAGETLTNTDVGKIYLELTDVAGTRTVKWFSNAAKTAQVAEGSRVGDGIITMLQKNASGLSGSVTVAYTVDDLDIVVDLQPFVLDDVFSIVVTNDEAGLIQTLFKDVWGFSLESAVSPAETISEDLLREGVDHVLAGS